MSYLVEDGVSGIEFEFQGARNWVYFGIAAFSFLLWLVFIPLIVVVVGAMLQVYLPQQVGFLGWVAAIAFGLWSLWQQFWDMMRYVLKKETVYFEQDEIRIERRGLRLTRVIRIDTSKVQAIFGVVPGRLGGLGGSLIGYLRRDLGGIIIQERRFWPLPRLHTCGLGLTSEEVQEVLALIYQKQPHFQPMRRVANVP